MTPSDPRLFLMSVRYDRDFFALVAGHLQMFLCARPGFAESRDAETRMALLARVPGLATASEAFIVGLVFLIDKLGPKEFCSFCEERAEAKDDDVL